MRKISNIIQEEMAGRRGVKRQFVSKIEKGCDSFIEVSL